MQHDFLWDFARYRTFKLHSFTPSGVFHMATWKAAADDPEAGASDCSSASGGPCGFLAVGNLSSQDDQPMEPRESSRSKMIQVWTDQWKPSWLGRKNSQWFWDWNFSILLYWIQNSITPWKQWLIRSLPVAVAKGVRPRCAWESSGPATGVLRDLVLPSTKSMAFVLEEMLFFGIISKLQTKGSGCRPQNVGGPMGWETEDNMNRAWSQVTAQAPKP